MEAFDACVDDRQLLDATYVIALGKSKEKVTSDLAKNNMWCIEEEI